MRIKGKIVFPCGIDGIVARPAQASYQWSHSHPDSVLIDLQGAEAEEVQQADLLNLPYPEASFDHVFVCFVLEHLPDPRRAR